MWRFYFKIRLVHVLCIIFLVYILTSNNLLAPTPISIGEISTGAISLLEGSIVSQPEDEPKNVTLSAYFVGDVMLARHVEYLMSQNDSDYPFKNLFFLKNDTDFAVGNFEATVPKVHQKTPNFGFSFSVDKKYLSNLSLAGFTHLSLANNHSLDKGMEALTNTKEVLAENSITVFGSPKDLSTSSITYLEKNGLKIALVGLHAVDTFPSEEQIRNLVSQIDADADYQVAYIHWGVEYQKLPGAAVEQLAAILSGAGFNIIIGHHPHVTQSIKQINNTLVFYSLGNLIFDQYFSKEVQEGLVLKIDFGKELSQISLLPVTSVLSPAQPRQMTEGEANAYLENLAKISDSNLQSQIREGALLYAKILATSSEIAIMRQ